MTDTLLINVSIPGSQATRVLFNDETILAVGRDIHPTANTTVMDASGMLLLPGAIDAHVHFREPGLTHKATMASESRAALAGGVTSWLEMPNTKPATTTEALVREKEDIAARTAVGSYAFFIGATNDNVDEVLGADFTHIPGIKVFMGSSTGNMLVDSDNTLRRIFAEAKVPVVVHAEDEAEIARCKTLAIEKYGANPPVAAHPLIRSARACTEATRRALELARRYGTRLHVAHISTAAEVEMIRKAKAVGVDVTCEVSPSHLIFCDEDYAALGARIKMNPAIKTAADRQALREAVADGTIDMIATDHAPHLLAEKEGGALTAVSGAPMVQFSLVAMLDMFGPATVMRTMAEGPARVFGIERKGTIAPGCDADMVLVRKCMEGYEITDGDVRSLCGWTPLAGRTVRHHVERVFATHRLLRFRR